MEGRLVQGRPALPGGRLRVLRRNTVARAVAVFSLLAYVLIGIAPVWVPAVERGGIEVCTANGIRILPAPLPDSDPTADHQTAATKCPLCTIHGAFLLVPPACAVALVSRGRPIIVTPDRTREPSGLFAGFDHLSRAPPRPS
jgi:hypothetical protein